MSIQQTIKGFVKKLIVNLYSWYGYRGIKNAWIVRHINVSNAVGGMQESSISDEHKKYWHALGRKFSTDTLNACYTISGKEFKSFVPEEIYEFVIEKKLNEFAPNFFQHKSYYNILFKDCDFIEDVMHRISGRYVDANHDALENNQITEYIDNIEYPVVLKKSIDSAGGRDIHFAHNSQDLSKALKLYTDCVVQPVLNPHSYFRDLHDYGLNTIRVCAYRSIESETFKILNSTLRIGKDGSLDNETQGGLVCNLSDDGKLNEYAVDKYGKKYFSHPNSEIVFKEYPHLPEYNQMITKSLKVANKVPYARLVSLDLAMDKDSRWHLIEINLEYQTIRFAQYAGKPFFGKYTDEVISYCSQ
jgi:hypothetical protein